MLMTPPGVKRSWVEMLAAPWDTNPEVIIVMAPVEATFVGRANKDGTTAVGCMEFDGKVCATLFEQQRYFRQMGADMPLTAYHGPLSNMPDKLLNTADFKPLAFNTKDMSGHFLDLRAAGAGMTIEGSH